VLDLIPDEELELFQKLHTHFLVGRSMAAAALERGKILFAISQRK
jgi:hypothetical protein